MTILVWHSYIRLIIATNIFILACKPLSTSRHTSDNCYPQERSAPATEKNINILNHQHYKAKCQPLKNNRNVGYN